MGFFIIYNVIFSHFPTTVLTFGANIIGTYPWVFGYSVMEKIQMTFFSIQEIILGMMYLTYTKKMTLSSKFTSLVRQTLYINVIVLCLDLSMLICEYVNLYDYQIMLKVVVYSVKLKLEFFILNLLSRSLQQNVATHTGYTEPSKGLHGDENHIHSRKDIIPSQVVDHQLDPETQTAKSGPDGN